MWYAPFKDWVSYRGVNREVGAQQGGTTSSLVLGWTENFFYWFTEQSWRLLYKLAKSALSGRARSAANGGFGLIGNGFRRTACPNRNTRNLIYSAVNHFLQMVGGETNALFTTLWQDGEGDIWTDPSGIAQVVGAGWLYPRERGWALLLLAIGDAGETEGDAGDS